MVNRMVKQGKGDIKIKTGTHSRGSIYWTWFLSIRNMIPNICICAYACLCTLC